MKYSLILLLLFSQLMFSQTNNYEETALNYFVDSIIPKFYSKVDNFIFSGFISNSEPSNSFCLKLDYIENYDVESTEVIDVSKFNKFSNKTGFFKGLFQSWKKRRLIMVYKHYPIKGNIVVVIRSLNKYSDDYFSILIDSNKKEVLNHCMTNYDF